MDHSKPYTVYYPVYKLETTNYDVHFQTRIGAEILETGIVEAGFDQLRFAQWKADDLNNAAKGEEPENKRGDCLQ
jgi:hypothetical protein